MSLIRLETNEYSTPREELQKRLDGKLWVSQDIAITSNVLIGPRATQIVQIEIPGTIELIKDLGPSVWNEFQPSTRSRFAQIGLAVAEDAGAFIAYTLQRSEVSEQQTAQVPLHNLSESPALLLPGTPLFRLFAFAENFINGQNLAEIITPDSSEASKIYIEGEYGKDWMWVYPNNPTMSDIPTGVYLKVKDNVRSIPHSNRIIDTSLFNTSFRQQIDSILRINTTSDIASLWIGEATHIRVPAGIVGYLHSAARINKDKVSEFRHIPSNIFDPHFNNTVRVEVWSPTAQDKRPQWVKMYFAPIHEQSTLNYPQIRRIQ